MLGDLGGQLAVEGVRVVVGGEGLERLAVLGVEDLPGAGALIGEPAAPVPSGEVAHVPGVGLDAGADWPT